MANESINLNLIPKGEMPVIHVSQFDNGRQFTINFLKARSSNDWLTNSLIVDPQAKFSNKKNTKTIRIGGFDKVSPANLFSFVLVTM